MPSLSPNLLNKTFCYLAFLPTLLAALAMFALMLLTFADVLLRSVANSPIEAATELTRLLMAVVVFSVLPVVSGRGEHISVDLLDSFYSQWLARGRDALLAMVCGAMLILPAQRCMVLAERARSYGDVTEYLNIPLFYMSSFIAIATFITAITLLLRGLFILLAPQVIGYNVSTTVISEPTQQPMDDTP